MSCPIKSNPPQIIKSGLQLFYFKDICDLLNDNGVALQSQDGYVIATLSINYAIMDECLEHIDEHGVHMEVQGDRHKIKKINPSIGMLKDAQNNIRTLSNMLCMSPSARKTVGSGIVPKPKSDNGDGFNDV
ncbi:MAG: phage terminase small subunit P27 family [Emcibacteraceae bacterium]|nr:phage terminase small subunit P27 family [Emcibacteraceae bacterium]